MTNILTLIITGLFALMGLAFTIYLLKAIGGNIAKGRAYRRSLEEQAQAEPLGDMIKAMGLPTSQYLHGESILNIRHQLHQCRHCPATSECLDWLDSGYKDAPPDFCPNGDRLRRTRETLKETS